MANFYRFAERALDRAESVGDRRRKQALEIAKMTERGLTGRARMTERGLTQREGMSQVGQTQRTGMTEAGQTRRIGMTEAGLSERQKRTELGLEARQRLGADIAYQQQRLVGEQALQLQREKPTSIFSETTNPITGEKTRTPGEAIGGKATYYEPPGLGENKKKKKRLGATGGWGDFDY